MYIYKVTNLKTSEFYFGFESTMNPATMDNLDPLKMFGNPAGSNGEAPMVNIVKEMIMKVGSTSEGAEVLSNLAKQYEDNDKFLGIKQTKKPIEKTPLKATSVEAPASGSIKN